MDNYKESFPFSNMINQINKIQKSEADLIHWQYDDGTEAAVVIDKPLDSKLFDSKKERKKYLKTIKNKLHQIGKSCETKADFLSAKNIYKEYQNDVEQFIDHYAEFLKEFKGMLVSCGQERQAMAQMAKLWSGITAGYIIRLFWNELKNENETIKNMRAPILNIQLKEGRWDTLKRVMKSVAVNMPLRTKQNSSCYLEMVCPNIFQSQNKLKRLNDFTFVLLHSQKFDDFAKLDNIAWKKKKIPIPSYCRDNAVLIHCANIKGAIQAFLLRNRWVSVIRYGIRQEALAVEPVHLDASWLSNCDDQWSINHMKTFSRAFIYWMHKKFANMKKNEFLKIWNEAENSVNKYNSIRELKRYRGQQETWAIILMLPVLMLTRMLEEECSNEVSAWWHDELFNLLLPGSFISPEHKKPIEQRAIDYERDSEEIVRKIICELINTKNSNRLLYVFPRENFEQTNAESEKIEYLGYLRQRYNKYQKPDFRALQMRNEQLISAGKQLTGISCDWENVIRQLKRNKPPYLYSVKLEFMPADEVDRNAGKKYNALVFNLDEMDFLSEQQKVFLKHRFQGVADSTAWETNSQRDLFKP